MYLRLLRQPLRLRLAHTLNPAILFRPVASSTGPSLLSSAFSTLIIPVLPYTSYASSTPNTPCHQKYTTTRPTLHRCVREMTESEFDDQADEFLEDLMDDLEVLESTAGPEFEIDYAMGVLTLVLNVDTTYVINKQRPNRQVWMSSPTSGPRRFELDEEDGNAWVDVRSRDNLLDVMKGELKELVPDVDIEFQ